MHTQNSPDLITHLEARLSPLIDLVAHYAREDSILGEKITIQCIHPPEEQGDDWLFGVYEGEQKSPSCIVLVSFDEKLLRVYPGGERRKKHDRNQNL